MSRISILLAGIVMVLGASLSAPASAATAIFAGGCFWCTEADFDKVAGVTETISGFTGGSVENPTYQQVARGGTGHYEAVRVTYNPSVVSYEELLDVFWHSVDVTDAGGQFCDRGDSYRTAVFVANDAERTAAEASKRAVASDLRLGSVVTPILDAVPFYAADPYHQNYYLSDVRILTRFGYVSKADAYKGYREGCGRDARLRQVWGSTALQGIH
jgi:peptide-methionine (S)-S-oxide reductase